MLLVDGFLASILATVRGDVKRGQVGTCPSEEGFTLGLTGQVIKAPR